MRDQNVFMKQMLELVDLARANGSRITKREVAEFCGDLELTSAQLTLVHDFLDEHGIKVEGHRRNKAAGAEGSANMSEQEGQDGFSARDGKGDGPATVDSKYLSHYRRELRELREYSPEEREELYGRLISGDQSVMQEVIESHLKRVVTLAGKYKNRGVPLEDLIQEANLTLITTVDLICGDDSVTDVRKEIDQSIKKRLIELADSHMAEKGMEHTIVARTNLIHEATKVLAEEWGRLATIAELAEYTKMTEDEIRMYVDLSLEEIKVGKD